MGRKRRRGESNNWGRMDKNWWITNYVYAVISGLCVRSHNKICFFFNLLLFLYMITYFLSIPHIKIFFLLLCTIMTKSLWLLKSDLYLTLDSKLEFYLHFAHFINNKKATYWSIDSWDWKTLLKTCPPGRKVCSWSDLVSLWGSGWWTTRRTWTGGWSGRWWGSRVSQNHILQRNNANISKKIWRDSLRLYLASWLAEVRILRDFITQVRSVWFLIVETLCWVKRTKHW